MLGLRYLLGHGMRSNRQGAYVWFRKAVDKGVPVVYDYLAALYREVERWEEAIRIYEAAFDFLWAAGSLFQLYTYDSPIKKLNKAYDWSNFISIHVI